MEVEWYAMVLMVYSAVALLTLLLRIYLCTMIVTLGCHVSKWSRNSIHWPIQTGFLLSYHQSVVSVAQLSSPCWQAVLLLLLGQTYRCDKTVQRHPDVYVFLGRFHTCHSVYLQCIGTHHRHADKQREKGQHNLRLFALEGANQRVLEVSVWGQLIGVR